MPYVKIELIPEGVTRQKKAALIAGVTRLLSDVLNKDPQLTHVVIQEIATDDWGWRGQSMTEILKNGN